MPTLEQYGQAAELIYPGLGAWTYATFDRLNRQHFDGAIPLMPIRWHHTLAYGGSVGVASAKGYIELGMYRNKDWNLRDGKPSLYAEHVLLHEMIHQHLMLNGQNPNHDAWPWCREIMRIGTEIGIGFKAEPTKVVKVKTEDGKRKSERKQGAGIPLKMIARFPHFAFDYERETIRPAFDLDVHQREGYAPRYVDTGEPR
jgi:hypothetical protein